MDELIQEDFDEKEVLDLVSQALSDKGDRAFKARGKIPLAFGDSALLERLDEILSKYLNKADVQMVLHDLRTYNVNGINLDDTLEQLHIVTKNCIKCKEVNSASLPFWNVSDPDVVFVSDSPYFDSNSMDYFTKTASKSGFTSTRICMTFVNRCLKKNKSKYSIEEIESCSPYLMNEIQILRPKLIVPLGLVATCSLLPAKIHMNEERGKIIWLGNWAILPTFSPAYALRGKGNLTSLFEQDMDKAYNFVYGEK